MRRLAVVLALVGLSACARVMHTDYDRTPPDSVSGKACIHSCEAPKEACMAACAKQKNQCEDMARNEASSDYNSYSTQKILDNRTPSKTEGDFYRLYDYACNSDSCEAACAKTYNGCYENCGGKVTPHSYCTAFCN